MFEEHLANEISKISQDNRNDTISIIISGRETRTRSYEKTFRERGLRVYQANNRQSIAKALSDVSGPVVVVILKKQIEPEVKLLLASACERLESIFIIRLYSLMCIDRQTNKPGIAIDWDHSAVAETNAALRAAEASAQVFPLQHFKEYIESINKPLDYQC